jgi:hypothetical protein
MPDDPKKRGPQDRTRINVQEKWELDYWSKHFAITPEQLKRAVATVGVMVADVKKYLKK